MAETAPHSVMIISYGLGEARIGLLDDRAEIAEHLRGLRRRGLDFRVELLHIAEPRAPGDAQAAHAVVEADAKSGVGVFHAVMSRSSGPAITRASAPRRVTVRVSGPTCASMLNGEAG